MEYFTPNIEDIRVGYECERGYNGNWYKEIITEPIESQHTKIDEHIPIEKDIQNKEIRTPYLTKEQIEAEGWKYNPVIMSYDKGDYKLFIFSTSKQVMLDFGCGKVVNIPSINELRTIQKLLNIK